MATETENIVINNSLVNVRKSDNVLINAVSVKAENTENYLVADSTITNAAVSPTYSQLVKATEGLILPTQSIQNNGVASGFIPSVGTINITTNITPLNFDISGRTLNITLPKEVFIKGLFKSGSDTMETLTIDAESAGTFTSTTNDGGSGTITFSKNGGAFAAFSSPLVLANTDTLVVKRTTTTSAGFFKLTGTY